MVVGKGEEGSNGGCTSYIPRDTGTGSDSDILTPILHVAKLLRLFSLSLSTTSHRLYSASHIASYYILSTIYVAC